jgi:hypothetical protein
VTREPERFRKGGGAPSRSDTPPSREDVPVVQHRPLNVVTKLVDVPFAECTSRAAISGREPRARSKNDLRAGWSCTVARSAVERPSAFDRCLDGRRVEVELELVELEQTRPQPNEAGRDDDRVLEQEELLAVWDRSRTCNGFGRRRIRGRGSASREAAEWCAPQRPASAGRDPPLGASALACLIRAHLPVGLPGLG